MTDKELLEAAAKAAGIDLQHRAMFGGDAEPGYYKYPPGVPPLWAWWSPLTDDGDAFRLAVKMGLLVDLRYTEKHESMRKFNRVNYWPTENGTCLPIEFGEHDDPYAAVRRAIVRAAAEIGKHS